MLGGGWEPSLPFPGFAEPGVCNRPLRHCFGPGETFRQDDEKDLLTRQIEVTFGKIGIDDISVAWADGQLSMLYSDSETRKLMAMEAAEELAEDLADLVSTAAG